MKTKNMNFIKKGLGLLFAIGLFVTFHSCSSDSLEAEPLVEDPVEEPDMDPQPEESFASNLPDQDPLNVVYFIPTDFTKVYESKETAIKANLSQAILFAQQWYKKQMELGGYPDKTFALSTRNSNTEVRVVPIYGKKASDQYANNNEIRTEVEAHFQNNPEDLGGEHTLVLSDQETGFNNNGRDKMAFTRSPNDYNMVDTGKTLDGLQLLSSAKFGTLLHELAHGLNVPHVAHAASDSPNLSLMGGGGANSWDAGGREDQVRLLASSLAILDVCAAFNKNTDGLDYYTVDPTLEMVEYSIEKNHAEQATRAKFTFTSDVLPKHLYVTMDAEPTGVNSDYDQVAFTTRVAPTGNIHEYGAELDIPYSEFFNGYDRYGTKTDNTIVFSVNIIAENGFRKIPLSYNFTISSANSPVPDDTINRESFSLSDRSTWAITANTTNQGQPVAQGAATMLDGDFSSFWFSAWPTVSAADTPHIIHVDLGGDKTFKGIYMHSLRTPNPQFRPKHIVVELSDDNATFTLAADHTEAMNNPDIRVMFDHERTARHIRITVDGVHTTNGVENLTINELDILP